MINDGFTINNGDDKRLYGIQVSILHVFRFEKFRKAPDTIPLRIHVCIWRMFPINDGISTYIHEVDLVVDVDD